MPHSKITNNSQQPGMPHRQSTALEELRLMFVANDLEACLAVAEELLGRGTPADSLASSEVALIGASVLIRLRRYGPAEEWLKRAGDSRHEVEHRALQAIIHSELGEHDKCVKQHALIVNKLDHDHESGPLCALMSWLLPALHNAVGSSHYSLGAFETAEKSFLRGIKADKDIPELYIGLSRTRNRLGDTDGERQALSEGLIHCSQKTELQKLARKFLGEESISLCMIVKNEEEHLDNCLESVAGLVQEIVVVDTGSEDATVEIAKKHGAKVYHHPWENDFSKHRNQSISYASGDWILIMDADEELLRDDHDKLRAATCIPDVNAISISVYNKNRRTGEVSSFLTSTRLWRRKIGAHYEGIVHNELRLPPTEPILRADVRLWHYGYALDQEKLQRKIARTKPLLEKQLQEDPNNPFTNFNYAQLLRGESKHPSPEICHKIIEHSGRTVANTDPESISQRHLHVSALDQMSAAYFYLGQNDRAAEASLRALKIDSDYIDPMFNLGHIYAADHQYDKAVQAFTNYLKFVKSYDPGSEINNYILLHSNKQAEAHYGLGLVYERSGDNERAVRHFERVFEYKKDYLDTHTHLARLCYNRGDHTQARKHAEKRVAVDSMDLAARFILAELSRRAEQTEEALEHYEAILRQEPDHPEALLGAMESFRHLGDGSKALDCAERLLTLEPRHRRALTIKAEILFSNSEYAQAAGSYRALIAIDPNDAESHNNLGNCLFKPGEFASASESYQRALDIKPQMTVARRNLGICSFKVGDLPGALDSLTAYLSAMPDDLDVRCLVAQLLYDTGRYMETIEQIEICLQSAPGSAGLVALAADCYLKLGHSESAKLGYEHALKLDPNLTRARDALEGLIETLPQSR